MTEQPIPVSMTELRFDDRGLIPAIVQQHDTGEVLMMAWMNTEAITRTQATGQTHFWSRSRGELWHKGVTSGNVQHVHAMIADCDADVLLLKVDQRGLAPDERGVACHTGARTCFHQAVQG